jgi:hypothetical protein
MTATGKLNYQSKCPCCTVGAFFYPIFKSVNVVILTRNCIKLLSSFRIIFIPAFTVKLLL